MSEADDIFEIDRLLNPLNNPYGVNPEDDIDATHPPDWAVKFRLVFFVKK